MSNSSEKGLLFAMRRDGPNQKKEPIKTVKQSRAEEIKIYGRHACLAAWRSRPKSIIRVYIDEMIVKEFGDCLKYCAQEKIAYHVVPNEELDKITESTHHEGVCFLVRRKSELSEAELIERLKKLDRKESAMYLFLDGVKNPHNLGSIVRMAAHFGIRFILGGPDLPKLSGAATRVAEGGAESVSLVRFENSLDALKKLKSFGFKIISTSSRRGASLFGFSYPKRVVLIVGGESEGVRKEISQLADTNVAIPGSGAVESLNVSSATSILLGEWWRQINIVDEPHS